MHKIILFIILFSFVVQAKENTKDFDIKNLTNMQIYCKVFDLIHFHKYQEALDFCNEVLKHKPHNPEAHFEKGRALAKFKRWREAVGAFNLAIKYKRIPLGEVYYEKGMLLEALGKFEEALEAYDLAIENNFEYRYVYYFKAGVERKRKK